VPAMSEIRRFPANTKHSVRWIEERTRPGVRERRTVTASSWDVVERFDCFCCSCGVDMDMHCRMHGFDGRRACELHGMPGRMDTYGVMPVAVHVRRAELLQEGL
jgi:hypothetical protein